MSQKRQPPRLSKNRSLARLQQPIPLLDFYRTANPISRYNQTFYASARSDAEARRERETFYSNRRKSHRRSMTRHIRFAHKLSPERSLPTLPTLPTLPLQQLDTDPSIQACCFWAKPAPGLQPDKPRLMLHWKAFSGDIVPESREGATMCCIGDQIFLFGGLGSRLLNDLFILDLSARQWRQLRPGRRLLWPDERYGHSCTVVGRDFFIFGGQQRFNELRKLRTCFNDLWRFSTYEKKFYAEYVNGFTVARAFHAAVAIRQSVLVHGGLDKTSSPISDLSFYSLDLQSWIDLPVSNEGPGALAYHAAVAIFDPSQAASAVPESGAVYFFGGKGVDGCANNSLWTLIFDRRIARWQEIILPNAPAPRYGHQICHLEHINKLIILGGKGCEDSGLWTLSLDDLEWKQGKPGGEDPMPRSGHCATVAGQQIVTLGGLGRQSMPGSDVFMLFSARFFASAHNEAEEYKKAFYRATGEVFSRVPMSRALARFNPKRLQRIQRALQDLEEKQLLRTLRS